MLVFLCFLKQFSMESAVAVSYGKYHYVDLLVVDDAGKIEIFGTRAGGHMKGNVLPRKRIHEIKHFISFYDFLLVDTLSDESQTLLETCRTFALVKTPFNRRDCWLYFMPLRSPREIPLFETTTLSDTQAVILFFRECLRPFHAARTALHGLHSRQTVPVTLYETLLPVCKPLSWVQVDALLPAECPSASPAKP